ncbi:hypothetical protein HH214_02670 [Mucilaginibacter robiniae]|uniref:Uncharacterized protein n=1 Tax=Mucilaginibacter robiniae TaxID=2728022 RepID=A0A7L5DX97_9SPHI|nr:hypothetical protein [Mucilaginibacter robiniae]QJD94858.1 hypothetical protein HH214_02670 [Mucilaginibacter robiniae]
MNTNLQNQGLNSQAIEGLLKPGFDLYNNEIFWNNQMEGLAFFLADGLVKTIQLPFAVKEEVFVNHSFFISPLLPAISNTEEFYLLVLSKHEAKFYQGNAFGLQRVEVEGLPNGMDDVVHFEEKEDQQLFRQGSKGSTSFHGHGEGQLDDKANLGIYFHEVDKTLFTEILHDKHAPLVLAGVEYLIPIYKGLSKYNFIAEDAITGNQEHGSLNTLLGKAREILEPYFKQRTKKALQNYYNQIATPLTSSMPEKVIPASFYAQVSDLFICKDVHLWGTFNEAENKLEIHQEKQNGDECLLNQAAAKTYTNGGAVYLLNKEHMPKESIVAAFMRY